MIFSMCERCRWLFGLFGMHAILGAGDSAALDLFEETVAPIPRDAIAPAMAA